MFAPQDQRQEQNARVIASRAWAILDDITVMSMFPKCTHAGGDMLKMEGAEEWIQDLSCKWADKKEMACCFGSQVVGRTRGWWLNVALSEYICGE